MGIEPLLVTGASGFLGGHVIARAEANRLAVTAASGDLREPDVARDLLRATRPAAVVHLAAPRRLPESNTWARLVDEFRMAANVLRFADELTPGAVVLFAGSASQYGMGAETPLSEDFPTGPVSPHGAIKCVVEAAVLSTPLREATRVVWTRTFNLLGPGQDVDAPAASWARQVAAAEREGAGTLRTGDLRVVRDFLDVRDVADAYLALLASAAEGVVNVGSGIPTVLADVAAALVELGDVDIRVVRDQRRHRGLDPPKVVADVTRLRSATRWAPAYSLRQSLEDMLQEWRSRPTQPAARTGPALGA